MLIANLLGHQITGKGSIPLPSKVHAITHHPKPNNDRGLQELLRIIIYFHRFIPNTTTTLHPLYCVLKGKPKNQCLVWSNDMRNVYTSAITSLASATLLAHPCSDVPIALTCDDSVSGIEAVFEQFVEGACL